MGVQLFPLPLQNGDEIYFDNGFHAAYNDKWAHNVDEILVSCGEMPGDYIYVPVSQIDAEKTIMHLH